MRQMEASNYQTHPMVRYVRSLDGDFMLRREVADELGCSLSTLTYLAGSRSPERLGPTHTAKYGGTTLHLYAPARVSEIREYLARKATGEYGRGRPRMWTHEEAQARQRENSRRYSYRSRAKKYRADGEDDMAAEMDRRADAIERRLNTRRYRRSESKKYQQRRIGGRRQ